MALTHHKNESLKSRLPRSRLSQLWPRSGLRPYGEQVGSLSRQAHQRTLYRQYFPVIGMKNINELTLSDLDKAFIPTKCRSALETARRICARCIEILSYVARFRYLEDKNLIFPWQQYKKEDLSPPTKGQLATIYDPDLIEFSYHMPKITQSETPPIDATPTPEFMNVGICCRYTRMS